MTLTLNYPPNQALENRGEKQSARTHVEGPKQHMPIGMKWQEFLSVGENKEQLISLLGTYFENLSNNNLLSMPLIFTTGDKTLHLENGEETIIKSCSHEEADTRLVLHAIEQESDVVVVCKDTDVLMLLVWAYSSYKVTHNWYFKYEGEKYACIRTIVDSLGPDICSVLPAFHAITGCDTTSYLYRIGKVRAFNKLTINSHKAVMLKTLGQNEVLHEEDIEGVKEFIRTVLYTGKENENYVDTRIRLYENLKRKSSMPLPPDPDSVIQVIKRAHHQTYSWVRCGLWEFPPLPHEGNGWFADEDELTLKPLWFTGPQLPPSASKKKKIELPDADQTDGVADGFADDESAPEPTKKKRLKKRKLFSSPEVEIVVILDEDVGELIVFDSERGVLDSGTIADEDEQPDIEFNLYDSSHETDEWANWEEEFVSGEDSDDELWLP